jgi:hypothetical protein
MKKLLSILLLSTTLTYSQTDFIKVLSVTDTVNVGDSITIVFTKTTNNGGNGMSRLQLWTSTYLQDCMYKSSAFLSDTNTIKVKILPIMGFGNARIYSNATPNYYYPFYIKQNDVSVIELTKYEVTNITYYDIYGKEKPSHNEGLTIRITTYSNGYQKKDKIIILLQ